MDIGILQQRRTEAGFAKDVFEGMAPEIGAETRSRTSMGGATHCGVRYRVEA